MSRAYWKRYCERVFWVSLGFFIVLSYIATLEYLSHRHPFVTMGVCLATTILIIAAFLTDNN